MKIPYTDSSKRMPIPGKMLRQQQPRGKSRVRMLKNPRPGK